MATLTVAEHAVLEIEDSSTPGPRVSTLPLVLVAEDDIFTLKILEKRLQVSGYQVLTATDGQQALELFEKHSPTLVLSDWMMPKLDGRELCARIKGTDAGRMCYFIILTARDKNEDVVQALDTGADEYLVKPCDAGELMARVRAGQRILQLRTDLAAANGDLRQANDRINAEIRAVANIQQALLPQFLPARVDYRFAAHYRPSTECSGDFYEVLELPGGKLGLVVGDVSGHGGPAMVAMALVRMLILQTAPNIMDPAAFLASVNDEMFRFLPTEQYLTLFYGVLTPETGEFVYSSGGHTPPMRIKPGPEVEAFVGCEGYPIKLVGPGMEYDNTTTTIERGQTILIFTDGLPEAFNANGEMLGSEGAAKILKGIGTHEAEKVVKGVVAGLETYIGTRPMADDLTLLAVQRL